MPAVSKKQARFMNMCLTKPSAARKPCPSKKVANEFRSMKGRKR